MPWVLRVLGVHRTVDGDDADEFHCRMSSFVRSKEGLATQNRVWREMMEKLETIRPGIEESI